MIAGGHWPTDGEWKESVLRTVIRRTAPATALVGRGFVVTRSGASPQVDVLIYDSAYPVLYRDGDLVFISPRACLAAIEVKSRLTLPLFRITCERLADVAEFLRNEPGGYGAFVGLFAYEDGGVNPARALTSLQMSARENPRRVIDHVALGDDKFFKWWAVSPLSPRRELRAWHAYSLSQMAAGYFLHNLMMHLGPDASRDDDETWFPEQSKEIRMVASESLHPQRATNSP